MAREMTPAELAQRIEIDDDSNKIRPKAPYDFAAVDTFQEDVPLTISVVAAAVTAVSAALVFDLSDYASVKFAQRVGDVGNTGLLYLRYSLDNSTYVDIGSDTLALGVAGFAETAWETLPALAQTLCYVKAYTRGGDGAEAPSVVAVAHFRR